jgi:hypothetical protein
MIPKDHGGGGYPANRRVNSIEDRLYFSQREQTLFGAGVNNLGQELKNLDNRLKRSTMVPVYELA